MEAALTQSNGAWLPQQQDEQAAEKACAAVPDGLRLLLDAAGAPLLRALPQPLVAPVSIAVGPEGGLEADERSLVIGSGFVPVSLGDTILRFETAGVAALAAIRAALSAAAAPTP